MTTKQRERHEKIIKMRASGLTYKEIGDYFDITRERVRQILAIYGKDGLRKVIHSAWFRAWLQNHTGVSYR